MRNILVPTFLGLMASTSIALASPSASPGAMACSRLTQVKSGNLSITEARWVDGDQQWPHDVQTPTALPAHCLVRGEIDAREGVPAPTHSVEHGAPAFDRHYGIHFELRLPQVWAQRLYYEGGGGSDGVVAEAIGHVPSLKNSTGYIPALYRGFAVVTSDAGHSQAQNPGFGMDSQARLDYGYASIGKVTTVARNLIKHFYAREPRWSYFAGCSKGGQEALQAMQRYGNQFNGIIAGAPGYRLPRAAIAEAWDSQSFAAVAPHAANTQADLSKAFSEADLNLVAHAVMQQCAGDDGTQDGLITAPLKCQFNPASLRCASGKQDSCLSGEQVTALQRVFGGPKGSAGKALYNSWFYDSGIASPGWRDWKLGSTDKPALNLTLGGLSLKYVFLNPPRPDFNILTLPIDEIAAGINAKTAAYPQSALDFMEASSTALTAFRAHQGKLILYHGVSDPVFSARDTLAYYQQLKATFGPATEDFARLFLVPGMNHCGGGQYALDSFDTLDPIINWVEHDKAPERLEAFAGKTSGKGLRPGLTRALCAYPQTPHYLGKGDPDKASAFECR